MKEGLGFTLPTSQLPCASLLWLKQTQKLEMCLLIYKQGFIFLKKSQYFISFQKQNILEYKSSVFGPHPLGTITLWGPTQNMCF